MSIWGKPTAGKQTEQLAELLDLYPTLCDLAGIDTPDFIDGSSLAPVLNDVSHQVRQAAVNQYYRSFDGSGFMGYSIRTNSHRLMEWRFFETGEVVARELYDHQEDHSETENIIDSASKELVAEITELLLATHPRKGLVMTPAVHSNPNTGPWQANISFSNQTKTEITVYPITPTRRRGKAGKMASTEEVTINARIGGVYVVESEDGRIHEIHSHSIPERTVVVK